MSSNQGPAPRRPTMSDVAALAKVSPTTVSRVVGGVATVDPALAARVHAAIEMLGFRPNLAASVLARGNGRSDVIGVLVEDVGNPFFATVLRAVENVARPRGVDVLVGSIGKDPVREQGMVLAFLERRIDGLLLAAVSSDQSYLQQDRCRGMPVVAIDREPQKLEADCVVVDNVRGARTAIEHLLAYGHRCIGYLGGDPGLPPSRQRFEGYLQALAAAGIPPDDDLVCWRLSQPADAQHAVQDLLTRRRPTAFFAGHSLTTEGAIRALHTMGLQQRIALIGFDDFPLAGTLRPAITTMARRPAELGRLAAEILFARIGGSSGAYVREVVPCDLIARGSGELPARTADPNSA